MFYKNNPTTTLQTIGCVILEEIQPPTLIMQNNSQATADECIHVI